MRILMLTNRYGADARGGTERVVATLAEALRERGHDVSVRARTTVGFRSLHRMPVALRAVWHCVDLCNVVSAWSFAHALRREHPDVVHTHNLVGCGGLSPLVIRQYCRRTSTRWIHTLHDVQLITPSGLLMVRSDVGATRRGRPSGMAGTAPRPYADSVPATPLERSILARWFRAIRRRMFGSPHMVTSPSRWLLQLHRGERFFPMSRDVVIGNPVPIDTDTRMQRGYADTRMISPPPSWRGRSTRPPRKPGLAGVAGEGGGGAEGHATTVVYANAVGTPSISPSVRGGGHSASSVFPVRTLLFVGQLEGHKGVLVLLEAYTQLRALFPDIALHVVGDGSLLQLLKRASRDVRNLAVRGRLDADGVATAIAHADLVVVPSLCAENQPTVILEAFAVGVPVVASRVGGIPEMVTDGATGFLTDPGSVEDLVRVLRACIEDPRRVRAMGIACREQATAHDPSEVAKHYEALYTYGAP